MSKKKTKDGLLVRDRVSIARFLILKPTQEMKKRWKKLGIASQIVYNTIWQTWLNEHLKRGSGETVKRYMQDTLNWHNADHATRGPKPKCELKAVDSAISAAIYRAAADATEEMACRPIVLLCNQENGKIVSAKGTNSAFPRWMLILAGLGEFPSASRPLPIPFDKACCKLTKSDDDNWRMFLRLERQKRVGKRAVTIEDECLLKTRGKNLGNQLTVLKKIAAGEYDFCGSNLIQKDGSFYLHVCYRMPPLPKSELDADKQATLTAAECHPWDLAIEDRVMRMGGKIGEYIKSLRRRLILERLSRNESYRHASSARKGHGRRRATENLIVLRKRWQSFVKTTNQQLANDVVLRCVEHRAGRLLYLQPSKEHDVFVSSAGQVPGRNDASGWDFFQLKTLLERGCEKHGIIFNSEKMPQKEEAEEVAASQV